MQYKLKIKASLVTSVKWGGELSGKELGKAEVLSIFFVLVFPAHICSTASLVPGASAKVKYSSWQKTGSPAGSLGTAECKLDGH